MKPTTLRPGDRVARDGMARTFIFVDRYPPECGRAGVCVFDGDGLGRVTATDSEVIRYFHRLDESRPRG